MKKLFNSFLLTAVFAASILALSGCSGTLNSTTWVPPGDAFELGGGNVGSYNVTGTNTGNTSIEVLSVTVASTKSLGTIAPGAKIEHTFADGEMAKFRNLSSTERAELTIVVKGNIESLGMKYQGK